MPLSGSHGKGNEVSIFQKESPGETVINQENNLYNWWLKSKYKQCNNSDSSEICCGLKWNVNKCLWGGMRHEISFIVSSHVGLGFVKQVIPILARLGNEKRKTWGEAKGGSCTTGGSRVNHERLMSIYVSFVKKLKIIYCIIGDSNLHITWTQLHFCYVVMQYSVTLLAQNLKIRAQLPV